MKKLLLSLILGLCLCIPLASAGSVSTDTCYGWDTAMMLSMDGVDGGTTIVDDSRYNETFTASNSAQLDDSQKKFGTTSVYINYDTDDYITTSDRDSLELKDHPFTLDFWIRFDDINKNETAIIDKYDNDSENNSWRVYYLRDTERLEFRYKYVGGSSQRARKFSTWSVVEDTWYHVAVTRGNDDVLRAFIDGTQIGSTFSMTGHSIIDDTDDLEIGARVLGGSETKTFKGWIDEMRLVIGTPVWVSDFTPPSAAYTPCLWSSSAEAYNLRAMRQSTACETNEVSVTDTNSTVFLNKTSKSLYIENTGSTNEAYVNVSDGIATVALKEEIKLRPGADRVLNGFKTTEIGIICDTGESTTVFVEACY